jgi:hypothetical protein
MPRQRRPEILGAELRRPRARPLPYKTCSTKQAMKISPQKLANSATTKQKKIKNQKSKNQPPPFESQSGHVER